MEGPFFRPDLDGNLTQTGKPPALKYSKTLSTEIAWHTDADTIRFGMADLVSSIEWDINEQTITIAYHPGIQPLDLQMLRQIVAPNGILGHWRICQMGVQLCEFIQRLYEVNTPQTVLHPNRIGVFKNRLIVLPSMAGPIPPFPDLENKNNSYWMYFIAPEVFRSRGLNMDMFYSAGVYSLGKIAQLLMSGPGSEPNTGDDPFRFIENLVELKTIKRVTALDINTVSLEHLINAMCAFLPEDRPNISEALEYFIKLAQEADPEPEIKRFISDSQLEKAEKAIEELTKDAESGIFYFNRINLLLLKADYELSKKTPNYGFAIAHLREALEANSNDNVVDINLRIANAYEHFTGYSENFECALKHYIAAAIVIDWGKGELLQFILGKCISLAKKIKNPNKLLKILSQIPPAVRPEEIFVIQIRSYREINAFDLAWEKVMDYYQNYCVKYTVDTLSEALITAGQIPDVLLESHIEVTLKGKNNPGSYLLRAVILKRLGQDFVSQNYIEQALIEFNKNKT